VYRIFQNTRHILYLFKYDKHFILGQQNLKQIFIINTKFIDLYYLYVKYDITFLPLVSL